MPRRCGWGGTTGTTALNQPTIFGTRGYHIRSGGPDLIAYGWKRFADFADQVWAK